MTVAKPFFATMDLGYIRDGMRENVVGILGHDILSRCVAEITVADDSIKLFDPKTHRLAPQSWQALTFNQSVPAVSASPSRATARDSSGSTPARADLAARVTSCSTRPR